MIEYIELAVGIRNRGRIVPAPADTMPDYFGKTAPTDAYSSVYRFGADLAEFVKRTGSISGYPGPCRALGVHFDFDGPAALEDVRQFIEYLFLNEAAGVGVEPLALWFSGSKGFHVFLHSPEIAALPPATGTPDRIKRLAAKLAGHLPTFDRAVYDRTRVFRIANSRHSKTGLFKVPLFAEEMFSLSLDEIKTLATTQRRLQDAAHAMIDRYTTEGRYNVAA